MKKIMSLMTMLAVALLAVAQVPQFSSQSYAGWDYSHPSLEVNTSTILANKIVLYVNSQGHALTLTSPPFNCQARATIDMTVTWVTDQWDEPDFVKSRVALTAALLDRDGVTVDSVTWVPTTLSRTNMVNLSMIVPRGLTGARLRFASWKADVWSNGAVRQIVATSMLKGDVNHDGEVTVADVNAIIDVISQGTNDASLRERCDVNQDSEVTVADVNEVLDVILR